MDFSNVDLDECESDPCMNGAECTNEASAYSCVCVEGFTGVNCETGQRNNLIYVHEADIKYFADTAYLLFSERLIIS